MGFQGSRMLPFAFHHQLKAGDRTKKSSSTTLVWFRPGLHPTPISGTEPYCITSYVRFNPFLTKCRGSEYAKGIPIRGIRTPYIWLNLHSPQFPVLEEIRLSLITKLFPIGGTPALLRDAGSGYHGYSSPRGPFAIASGPWAVGYLRSILYPKIFCKKSNIPKGASG